MGNMWAWQRNALFPRAGDAAQPPQVLMVNFGVYCIHPPHPQLLDLHQLLQLTPLTPH